MRRMFVLGPRKQRRKPRFGSGTRNWDGQQFIQFCKSVDGNTEVVTFGTKAWGMWQETPTPRRCESSAFRWDDDAGMASA